MKLSELPALGEVIDRQREDPEFKEAWDRSAFAREVATLCRSEIGFWLLTWAFPILRRLAHTR
jgi:hypothetical protein